MHSLHTLDSIPPDASPAHLAIGIFDGVHRGHQTVIELALQAARSSQSHAAVLTFHPHPSRLFRPESPTLMIMPLEMKADFLTRLGVHCVISEPFTREFAALEAEAFLPYLHKHLPQLQTVYIGENFRFGNKRAGDPDKLVIWGRERGLHVVSVPGVKHDGTLISSTRIRGLIAEGEIASANALLGYPYYSESTVQPGLQFGRTLGFPTLNLSWTPELRPACGVYVVRVQDHEGRTRLGVANYGLRPTVNQADPTPRLEVHILDEDCPWDSGNMLRVEWLDRLREERHFDSGEALRQQIAEDCTQARRWHAQGR